MSSQTTPQAPFNQWQNFYPSSGPGPYGFGYDTQPVTMHDQIYATVSGNAERTKQQAANDIARDILRAVDHGSARNSHITEINAAQVTAAIERNGSQGMTTTERVNSQLASAVERNGAVNASTTERVNSQLASAVERNGAANMSAIERTTGEARLTTVIADAASRQAANDTARDILRSVDRTGLEAVTSTKDAYNGLLASVERNAGEGRIQTLTSSGILDNSLRDVRYSILSDVNRVGTDLNDSNVQTFNVLNKAITDSAWEQRTAVASGFQNISEEHLRTKFDLNKSIDAHYSSLLLEQQKLGHFMSAKADGHFASTTLELQKVKDRLATQSAMQHADAQLELQKVKEGLAHQASSYNAVALLEAHKNREAIQKDLAEARYEALKSQQYLTDKMGECCCEIKEKMDVIDRDRLRDNLIVSREDNNVLKILEFGGLGGGYGRGYGYGGRGRGSRSRSPGRR
jgi:hypothetical protein